MNWRLHANEDPRMVEIEDKDNPDLNPQLEDQLGKRVGE